MPSPTRSVGCYPDGRVSLGEVKIGITRKLVAAMAGALVVSGGRFFIKALKHRPELRQRGP